LNNSKLVNVLRTFSKIEIKEFEKFIISPYFNRGRNYLPFFIQLKKFHPLFDDDIMTPEYIYSKMYPGKKFNKQIIWNMTSKMLNMTEDYLMLVSLKRNRFVKDFQVAEELAERKLTAYYSKKLNDMDTLLDKMGLDDNYFRYKTQLENAKMLFNFLEDTQHLLPGHILKKGEYSVLNFMREISDVMGSLRVSSSMYNKVYDANIPLEFVRNLQLEKIISYAYNIKFEFAPVLEMYYLSIMLSLDFDNTEYFIRLMKMFKENFRLFSTEEKYLWSAELSNYCMQKINQGNKDFRKTIAGLDKFRLKEGILFTTKYLPKVTYMQILGNAFAANDIAWGEKIIEEYVPILKPSYQKPMTELSSAYLQYKLKNFKKVPEILSKTNFSDGLDKIYLKSLNLRAYYELNDIELLIYNIDSARNFFNTNKTVPDNLRGNYIKFLNCLNRLVALKENYDEFELEKLRKTVEADKSISLDEWLIEKIDEIKKGAN